MEKRFGLLGEKLGHSFSPQIHSYLGDYTYELFETAPDEVDSFMTAREFDGINVTIPYKQTVLPYCATLSKEAQIIGSVNTIIKDANGALHGYNTDYYGFRVMLNHGGIDPRGKKSLVLGSGGAARTVRTVLNDIGAGEVVTISRQGENHYGNISIHHDAEIIVNTTPVGMHPDNSGRPLSLAGFGKLSGVADLIYNPVRTRLILEAEKMGVPCISGMIMLVAQAEQACSLFTSLPARAHIVDAIHDRIIKETQNIALIGMPGCGKSTAGCRLAQMTGRQFVDIDERIEKHAGKTIPEIFAQDGEEVFRKLETRMLAEAAAKSGLVISTGGGIVKLQENLDLLRQNSIIVYMKRDLSKLATAGRPLSRDEGVQALALQRIPLYEAWADCECEVHETPEKTAERILDSYWRVTGEQYENENTGY